MISFDVKPANVLLDRAMRSAKLADVGLAKVLEHSQTLTMMVGSSSHARSCTLQSAGVCALGAFKLDGWSLGLRQAYSASLCCAAVIVSLGKQLKSAPHHCYCVRYAPRTAIC